MPGPGRGAPRLRASAPVRGGQAYLGRVEPLPLALIELPADDAERALRFWRELLDVSLDPRAEGEGEGWQSRSSGAALGIHARGSGPGDRFSLPYFVVDDLPEALRRVEAPGGSIVHPGEARAVCKDSEGT